MKIKPGLDVSVDEFWYELTDGGGLKPSDVLESQLDVEKVSSAIKVLEDFQNSCEEQIEGFWQ